MTSNSVLITARLALTEGRDRVVLESSPEARFLWARVGDVVSRADALKYGVLDVLASLEDDDAEDAVQEPEVPRRKPGRPPGSKNRLPSENK